MAEIAVMVAIDLLTPFVMNELSLISNLPEEVKAIKNELESISAFLKSAEERAIGDEGTKVWVKQVRTLAYDIVDVIEEFHLFQTDTGIGKLKSYLSLHVSGLAKTIQSIHGRAVDIGRCKGSYKLYNNNNNNDQMVIVEQPIIIIGENSQFSTTTTSSLTSTLRLSKQCDNNEVVGFEIPKTEIIDFISNKRQSGHTHHTTPSSPSTKVVVVVGMRGLGKTTLVQYICNDADIQARFSMRAMISVAPTPRRTPSGILRSLIKQFYENKQLFNTCYTMDYFINYVKHSNYISHINSMDRNSLQNHLRKILKNQRYLIVFDDAQHNDTEMMTYIKQILPTNNQDNKILVTTRYGDVASAWLDGSCHGLYRLKPLHPHQAWLLFCKKTFQSCHDRCPPNLEDLARGIVRKCEGLPPAILALGRLLSTKLNDLVEWQKVYDSLGFYLQKNSNLKGIHEIFIRNYYDLPCHLKPCFLYFGVFPKGFHVDRMRLIRLWIAEGFITKKSRVNLELEEIAQETLDELISMSLVEIAQKDQTGRPKTLRVHEFLHEVILSKIDELNFCHILSKNHVEIYENPRRLSIHNNHKLQDACEFLKSITKNNYSSSIRCLFAFGLTQYDKSLAKALTTTFLDNILLLKVVDLRNAPITEVPLALGKLRNLHYLSLRNTRVSMLPTSIGKLQDLQTLDLKQTLIRQLPNEIIRLHKLRHLLIYSYEHDLGFNFHIQKVRGVKLPKGVSLGNFKNLQKLGFLDMGNETKVTKELSSLRRLGIIGLKSKDGIDLCIAMQEMTYLQALNLYSENKSEIDLNHFLSSPPPKTLKRLYLNGELRCFPRWISDLHNLVTIRLRWSNLDDIQLFEKLSALPNLMELQLLEAYKGRLLEITNGGFQKLKILQLLDLHQLEGLLINNTALPLLEHLSIGESQNLQVPSTINYLRNLKTLELLKMPPHFINGIQHSYPNYSLEQHVRTFVYSRFKCQQPYYTCT